jgi:transcription factor SPN1
MFAVLAKLPIGKEALIASGLARSLSLKSKRPELGIKRQAEKLVGEWTRPILKRSDDYRQRNTHTQNTILRMSCSAPIPTHPFIFKY